LENEAVVAPGRGATKMPSSTSALWRIFRKELAAGLSKTQTPRTRTMSQDHSQRLRPVLRATSRTHERCFVMMRPDHIFLAMTMIKHGTLAGAFIFAFKLLRFAVHTI
jgi:hypothetical protein